MSRATMRNLADVSYPMRHVLRRIFTYLKDTIIDEFPWFVSGSQTLEILESKRNKGTLSAKHVATELLTFAIICGFLVVLIILSLKCGKEDDEEEEERQPQNAFNEVVNEPLIGSTYTLALNSDDSKENLQHRHDRGDSPTIASLEGQVYVSRIPSVTVHNFIGTVGPPALSAREPLQVSSYQQTQPQQQQHHHHNHHQQQRESAPFHQQRSRPRPRGCSSAGSRHRPQAQRQRLGHQGSCRNIEWFVRRTRSGQIYGLYPF